LSAGSISLRLYPHPELGATGIVDELQAQAARAAAAGFDGVMTSEHHGGFAGYLPNPIQAAGWALEAMETGAWAAPCPLLLPLRPTALVIEELAWLAARFPGRVGLGVAAGSLVDDFAIMGLTKDDLTARFAASLAVVADALGGRDPGLLGGDAAVARCATHPVPVLSAAMSSAAVRRAAGLGIGILVDSLSGPDRARTLIDTYRQAGGPVAVLIRRVWIGDPPTDPLARQVERYRTYAAPAAQAHWTDDQLITGPDPASVADQLQAVLQVTGADACNLRVHAADIPAEAVRDQIDTLADVVDRVRL
jgi:alkanesulfonate monooxygenase SsuD/methylene tetrahydromethanopterin reductase-like flavin-dependent oxidoreductase (luciferase family)